MQIYARAVEHEVMVVVFVVAHKISEEVAVNDVELMLR